MAIQLRRGDYADFDPSQLLDGELAVVLENDPDTDDGTGTYVSYGEGNVKRLLTEDDTVDVDVATTETAGIVKPDGTTITVDNDGTIHGSDETPIATTGVAGKVRPDGTSIFVNEDGVISIHEATYDSPGIVQPDNVTITVTEYGGYIRVPTATDESLGLVQPDGETLDIDSNGVLSVIGIDPYDSDPEMDGSPSPGSSDAYARGDHVHPTDTSRASASDLTSHTSDATAHVTAAERTTWNAKASTATATTSANGLMSASDKTKLDGIDTSAIATATANANNAATSANTAASAANTAASTANDAADRAEDAIDAIGDISEQAVPLMSESTRGGAKLGHGLTVEDGALGIGEVTDATDAGPIVELTAKGWAEQDTTSGKNLLQNGDNGSTTYNGVTITRNNGVMRFSGTATGAGGRTHAFYKTQKVTLDAGTYTFSVETSGTGGTTAYVERLSDNEVIANTSNAPTFTLTEQTEVYVGYNIANETAYNLTVKPQIELGSTATSYEPYSGGAPSPSPSYPQEIRRVTGHTISGKTGRYVDINVTHDGTTTTIPIPLPSRGWVAALPDGTADTLTLDGAGGYVWELATQEITFDGSSDETWALSGGGGLRAYTTDLKTIMSKPATQPAVLYADRYIVKTNDETYSGVVGISANSLSEIAIAPTGSALTLEDFRNELATRPITVLYPLATPTRESGYVDMPTVPAHAVISCPDLTDLTVRCCADEGAAEISAAWGKRYEERIAALESAVAELVANG